MHYRHGNGPLARAYIPFQVMGQLFSPKCALVHGTAFVNLYQPYDYDRAIKGRKTRQFAK